VPPLIDTEVDTETVKAALWVCQHLDCYIWFCNWW
jgi:hypothetical protein